MRRTARAAEPDPGRAGRRARSTRGCAARRPAPSTAPTRTTREVFGWVREGAPPGRPAWRPRSWTGPTTSRTRCTTWRTACTPGMITLAALRDPAERQVVARAHRAAYCDAGSVGAAELTEVFGALLALPCWPASFDGGPAAPGRAEEPDQRADRPVLPRRADRRPRSRRRLPAHPVRRPTSTCPGEQRLECALLKGVTAHYVMRRGGVAEAQARQRELITELAAAARRRRAGHAGAGAPPRPGTQAAGDADAAAGRRRPGRVADRYVGDRLASAAARLSWASPARELVNNRNR